MLSELIYNQYWTFLVIINLVKIIVLESVALL